jgi:hypothetical protein
VSRWFRYYDDAMNDPKLLMLSDSLFRAWVTLLCTASQNEGAIPSLAVAAISLRVKPARAAIIITELAAKGLLDSVEGKYFEPHNWKTRQFKSDTSNARVAAFRHREKQRTGNSECNVTSNGDEAPPETEAYSEAETDQQSLTPETNILTLKDVKEKAGSKPRHCAISRDKKRVFVWTGTPEWDAYAEDFRQSERQEPIPRADGGKWFKTQGQAAE